MATPTHSPLLLGKRAPEKSPSLFNFVLLSSECLKGFPNQMHIKDRLSKIMEHFSKTDEINKKYGVFDLNDFYSGLILFYRLCENIQGFKDIPHPIYHYNEPEHILYTCVMIGHKFLQDIPMANETWARLVGRDKHILNFLEIEVFKALQYNASVTPDEMANLKTLFGEDMLENKLETVDANPSKKQKRA